MKWYKSRNLNHHIAPLERLHCLFRLTRSGHFPLYGIAHWATVSLAPHSHTHPRDEHFPAAALQAETLMITFVEDEYIILRSNLSYLTLVKYIMLIFDQHIIAAKQHY